MAIWIYGLLVSGFYNNFLQKKIRPFVLYGLVFFVFAGISACSRSEEINKITIQWENKRAVGIIISRELVKKTHPDSLEILLKVRLAGKNPVSILGEYSIENKSVKFNPLVPFTRGLHYEVWIRDELIGTFHIPVADPEDAPALLDIFPSADTLPENLLKIYLHFSHSMREGKSGQYVTLLKDNTDTIKEAFLDLQPELWNENRTVLTLWLDPGRIKRDLQPNKLLGAPLQKNANYQIVISEKWPDQQGTNLVKSYTKTFVSSERDSLSPKPALWTITAPESGTQQPLIIAFGESLDYSLLKETLIIKTKNDKVITGKWQIGDEEKKCEFTPDKSWLSGNYKLQIKTKQEDLAGNNLNRPFDRDITNRETATSIKDFTNLLFRIEN